MPPRKRTPPATILTLEPSWDAPADVISSASTSNEQNDAREGGGPGAAMTDVDGQNDGTESSDDQLYEVESILDHARSETHPGLSYLVKWKDYDHSYNLWQHEDTLADSQILLIAYWANKTPAEISLARKFGSVPNVESSGPSRNSREFAPNLKRAPKKAVVPEKEEEDDPVSEAESRGRKPRKRKARLEKESKPGEGERGDGLVLRKSKRVKQTKAADDGDGEDELTHATSAVPSSSKKRRVRQSSRIEASASAQIPSRALATASRGSIDEGGPSRARSLSELSALPSQELEDVAMEVAEGMKSEDVVSAEGGAECGATETVKGKGKSKVTDSRGQADAPPPPQPSSDDTGNATFNSSSSLRQTSIQATESIVRPSNPSTSSRLSRASLSNHQATPQPPPSRDQGSVVEQKDQVAPPRPLPPTAEDVRQAAYQAVSLLCAPWKEGDLEFRPLPEEWADIISWEDCFTHIKRGRVDGENTVELFAVWAQYNYYSWISEIEARAKCPQKLIDFYKATRTLEAT